MEFLKRIPLQKTGLGQTILPRRECKAVEELSLEPETRGQKRNKKLEEYVIVQRYIKVQGF